MQKILTQLLIMFCIFSAQAQNCSSFQARFSVADSAGSAAKFYDSSAISLNAMNVTYTIKWGDGNTQTFTTKPPFPLTHYYAQSGVYNVCYKVSGYLSPNFCSDSVCKTVSVCGNWQPTFISSLNPANCNLCNGTVYIGGMKPTTIYYLSGFIKNGKTTSTTMTLQTNANGSLAITGLCAGVYTLFKIASSTMPNACYYYLNPSSPIVLSFQGNSAMSLNMTKTNPNGAPNGAITANATGGNPPYSYSWNTGATTKSIVNLTTGFYCVTVTDSCGQIKTACDSLIDQNACSGTPPQLTVLGNDSICVGQAINIRVPKQWNTGFAYLWQMSFDSTTWSNAPNGSADSLVGNFLTSGCRYFRCKVMCTNSGFFSYSVVKKICVKTCSGPNACSGTPPQLTLQGSDSVCPAQALTLFVSRPNLTGFNYQWQISFDSINWNPISVAGPDTLSGMYFTSGCAFFRYKLICTNGNQFTYSTVKKVCMKMCNNPNQCTGTPPKLTIFGNDTICQGAQVAMYVPQQNLTGYTYLWQMSFDTINWTQAPNGNTNILTGNFLTSGCRYFRLKLICTNGNLFTYSFIKKVCVKTCPNNNPCANVKAKFGFTVNGANVVFKDSSTAPGMGITYHWKFGDGTSSTASNPTKIYGNAGTYTVSLVITTFWNNTNMVCKDSTFKQVVIAIGNPCAKLTPYFSFTQTGTTFNFTNQSQYNGLTPVGVQWVFGDGTSSTQNNPTKTYANAGSYTVTLNVTAYDSALKATCIKSYAKVVYNSNNPCAGFDARFTYTKNFTSFNFNNLSVGLGTGTTYSWNFGNGATSTSASPSYTYPLPGIYRVVLKMSTQFGNTTCHDSAVYYIVANTSNPCKDSGFVNNYNYSCGTYISPVCGCDSITYSSYCAAYKAGVKQTSNGPCPKDTNYVKICGYVYNDVNKNCAKDSNEFGLNSIQIVLSGSQTNLVTYTNAAGYYFFFAPKGSYTIKQNLSQSTYNWNTLAARQLCPGNNASINVSAPVGGNTYCNNHFYDTIKTCKDLGIHITKYRNITPGFPRTLYLNYKNYSPFAVSNVKVYYKKNTVQTFVSATPAASGSTGNTYFWNIGTLAANQAGMIKVELFTPVGTPLGTIAKDSAWIVPDSGDCELANNKANLTDYCKGSWDPNDKAVSPAGEGDNGAITRDVRTLDYLVRFQNTGTAPAFNVKVEDQLDGDFDWTTLKINAVSHPFIVSIEDGGKLVFEFQDIMLPDSGTDEAASHGYINYSIDMKENLNYGTELTNSASIFFDFNEPIITNTTVNTLVQKTSGIISIQSNNVQVKMYPNPIQSVANFVIQSEKAEDLTIEIFDITGKAVRSIPTSIKEGNQTLSIPMNDVLSGMYIVNILSEGNKINSFKMIKE